MNKFRAWDKEINAYRTGDILLTSEGKPVVLYPKGEGKFEFEILDNVEIEFSTGLTDKNGKDIYEGDLTAEGEYIVFEDGIFGTTYEGNRQGVSRLSAKRCEHIVIVGNIYETPLPVA